MIAAFQWAADPDGNPETVADVPDVINNSWGTLGEFQEDICRPTLWRMLDRIEAAGTVLGVQRRQRGARPLDRRLAGQPGALALQCVRGRLDRPVRPPLGVLQPRSQRLRLHQHQAQPLRPRARKWSPSAPRTTASR